MTKVSVFEIEVSLCAIDVPSIVTHARLESTEVELLAAARGASAKVSLVFM